MRVTGFRLFCMLFLYLWDTNRNTMNYRFTIFAAFILVVSVFLPENLSAQENFKSDVHKEYDEEGNLTHFDSCWTWSFRSSPGFSFDSVFSRLFSDHWIDTGFHAGCLHMFPDHFFQGFPHHFHGGLHQEYWDSLFSMPFHGPFFDENGFNDFFETFPFQGFGEIFRDHMDWMNEFFNHYHFPQDSILFYQPREQTLPEGQDKPDRGIEL